MEKQWFLYCFILLAGLQGCIYDDLSKCTPAENFELLFDYLGDESASVFDREVTRVDYYIYNEQEVLIQKGNLNEEQLDAFQGIKLKLPPGRYHSVCVGNPMEATELVKSDIGTQKITECNLTAIKKVQMEHPITLDSLYLSYDYIEIPEIRNYTKTIYFNSIHFKFQVLISGLNTTSLVSGRFTPGLRINNLYQTYNFKSLQTLNTATYSPRLDRIAQGDQYFSQFNTLRFEKSKPVTIDLVNEDNKNVIYSLDLKKFIADKRIQISGKQEIVVPVKIEFQDTEVRVSVLNWDEVPVDPVPE